MFFITFVLGRGANVGFLAQGNKAEGRQEGGRLFFNMRKGGGKKPRKPSPQALQVLPGSTPVELSLG